jgi:hypothetical protein
MANTGTQAELLPRNIKNPTVKFDIRLIQSKIFEAKKPRTINLKVLLGTFGFRPALKR